MPKRNPPSSSDRTTRRRTGLSGQDLEAAKRDALLQLKIGRSAHLLTVVVSALLGLDAILLLFFFSPLPTLTGAEHGSAAVLPTVYLLLPLLAAVLLSTIGLGTKWAEFRYWPWEGHFSASVGGVALSLVAAGLYVGRVEGFGPWGSHALFPGFLALTLATITVSLLGLALTWRPWGSRQYASALCALLPLATSLLVYFPPTQTGTGSEPLAVALLVSAVLYQTSGSFLHLLSSGTQPHRQALVLSGQTRIGQLADEVQQKEEALRFRELALLRREADVETAEASARRRQEIVSASKDRLETLDGDLRQRSDALAQKERDLAGQAAELEGKRRAADDREKSLGIKSHELDQVVVGLNERAERLSGREGEQAQRDVELAERLGEVERREAELPQHEERLAAREQQIAEKTTEILRREGEVAAREQAAPAAGRGAAAPSALEQDLAAREARSRHLKTLLDEQNALLSQRAQEVASQARTNEVARRQIAERQATVAAREAALAQKEADLVSRLKAVEQRDSQLTGMLKDYQGRLQEVGRQQAEIARKSVDVDRSLASLPDREKILAEREGKLAQALSELEHREAGLLSRERAAEASEAEVALRRPEADWSSGATREAAPPVASAASAAGTGRSSRPMRARLFSSSSERPPRPDPESQDASDTLAPAGSRRYPDRLASGTPRLDDLLLGGLPPRSHVALVGDAFVGKEITLYAFVAEGLKRSEPIVLVTATRSPEEVSESLGLLLPQFREFEQKGKVTWVDASGAQATAGPHRLLPHGADDLAGILSALVRASKEFSEKPPGRFRVGFLGLSAVLAHGDERAGFSFLQNVVGILKPRDAIAMYSLEAGALSEPQVESLLSRMDGAILFRQDRDRTFLSVKGFGDVETRDWIECRATNRALVVGSFALERIR